MSDRNAPDTDQRWRPSATLPALRSRAKLYRAIRRFFDDRGYIEVDVPLLGVAGTSDLHIESFNTHSVNPPRYLQTSPEFAMKRLLAVGSGPIYSITKSFRLEEQGKNHNPEFSILEWYRPGFDDHALISEVSELLQPLFKKPVKKITYQKIFEEIVGVDPLRADKDQLKAVAADHIDLVAEDESKDFWLELLFSHLIQPRLIGALWFVHDYPASQSALAKVSDNEEGNRVARRFEVFYNGVELGNGYWELTDAEEQLRRFKQDNQQRNALGLPEVVIDTALVAALRKGMPECAGIAIGLDRLLMAIEGYEQISDVLTFPFDRA